MSEVSRYRHLVTEYTKGNGCDIGSGGDPMAPHAINIELPEEEYAYYNSNHPPRGPLQFRSVDAAFNLPFKDGVLDWVGSSHFLEDVFEWEPVLREWTRVLKSGGYLVIMVPDKEKWNYAIHHLGQPCNCAHTHESYPGELSSYVGKMNLPMKVVTDRLTECHPNDYNILFVAQRF